MDCFTSYVELCVDRPTEKRITSIMTNAVRKMAIRS